MQRVVLLYLAQLEVRVDFPGQGKCRFTKIATPSVSMMAVLSVANCTVHVPLVRGNKLQLPSVVVSFKLSLCALRVSVVLLSRFCTLSGVRSVYTWSSGCISIRNQILLSEFPLYPLCATAGFCSAFFRGVAETLDRDLTEVYGGQAFIQYESTRSARRSEWGTAGQMACQHQVETCRRRISVNLRIAGICKQLHALG